MASRIVKQSTDVAIMRIADGGTWPCTRRRGGGATSFTSGAADRV